MILSLLCRPCPLPSCFPGGCFKEPGSGSHPVNRSQPSTMSCSGQANGQWKGQDNRKHMGHQCQALPQLAEDMGLRRNPSIRLGSGSEIAGTPRLWLIPLVPNDVSTVPMETILGRNKCDELQVSKHNLSLSVKMVEAFEKFPPFYSYGKQER